MEQFQPIIYLLRIAHNDIWQEIHRGQEKLDALRARLADRNRFGPFCAGNYTTRVRVAPERIKDGRIVATDAMDAINICEALTAAAEEAAHVANAHRENELLPMDIAALEQNLARWAREETAYRNLIDMLTSEKPS